MTAYKISDNVVYAHVCDGDIIYVGSGTVSRAHSAAGRTKVWHDVVRGRDVVVEITGRYATRKAAFVAEYELIRMLVPTANCALTTTAHREEQARRGRPPKNATQWIVAHPSGKRFASIRAAATYYGISGAAVSISAKTGRPVYKARQTFSYVR